MPTPKFSERFADDLASVTTPRVEAGIMRALDSTEGFGDFGSPILPDSIRRRSGDGVRKVVVRPYDCI